MASTPLHRDSGCFAQVEPDQMAVATRVNHDVSGTVVRVDVHRVATRGTRSFVAELFRIECRRTRGGSAVFGPSIADEHREEFLLDQNTVARFAKFDHQSVHRRFYHALMAAWTLSSTGIAKRDDSVYRIIRSSV